MSRDLKEFIKQITRFAFTGGMCMIIDIMLLTMLTELFHIKYLISNLISFTIATGINYMVSKKWVFYVRDKHTQITELIVFLFLSIVGLGINTSLLAVFVEKAAVHYMPAKICATVCVSIYNYLTRKVYLEKYRWR